MFEAPEVLDELVEAGKDIAAQVAAIGEPAAKAKGKAKAKAKAA